MIQDQYNIEIAMSTTLNSQVVEEIVRRQVEEQTGRKVVKMLANYDGTKFEGYHITFASEPAPNYTYKNSKEFIETKWK